MFMDYDCQQLLVFEQLWNSNLSIKDFFNMPNNDIK